MTSLEQTKLDLLIEAFGYESPPEMLEHMLFASRVPSICMNPDCEYSTEYEPDQDAGWCDFCEEGSVKSCLILAELI